MNAVFYTFIAFLCVILIGKVFEAFEVWREQRRIDRAKQPDPSDKNASDPS